MSIVLNNLTNIQNVSLLNENFDKIEDFLNDKVVKREVEVVEANELNTHLDMNGNRIVNVPDALLSSDVPSYGQVLDKNAVTAANAAAALASEQDAASSASAASSSASAAASSASDAVSTSDNFASVAAATASAAATAASADALTSANNAAASETNAYNSAVSAGNSATSIGGLLVDTLIDYGLISAVVADTLDYGSI